MGVEFVKSTPGKNDNEGCIYDKNMQSQDTYRNRPYQYYPAKFYTCSPHELSIKEAYVREISDLRLKFDLSVGLYDKALGKFIELAFLV